MLKWYIEDEYQFTTVLILGHHVTIGNPFLCDRCILTEDVTSIIVIIKKRGGRGSKLVKNSVTYFKDGP